MNKFIQLLCLLLFWQVVTAGDFVPLSGDGIHDKSGAAIDLLQEPAEALADFPRDNSGVVDWVATLDNGLIDPRKGLTGNEKMADIDLNIVMKNTSTMPFVSFSHKNHTKWLTCSNCHVKIFLPQVGGNFITMADILEGEYCGVCHGKVAFTPFNCFRCHQIPADEANLR